MTKTDQNTDLVDLGSIAAETRGAVPGHTPDGVMPLCYPVAGMAAD